MVVLAVIVTSYQGHLAMEIKLRTLVIALLAIVSVSIAVVLPIIGWLTDPPAITETDIHVVMMLCISVGFIVLLAVVIATKHCDPSANNYYGLTAEKGSTTKLCSKIFYWLRSANRFQFFFFAIGALLMNMLEISADLGCTNSLYSFLANIPKTDETARNTLRVHYNGVVSHIPLLFLGTIFILLQFALTVYHVKEQKASTNHSQVALLAILVVNIALYAYTFLLETEEELHLKEEATMLLSPAYNASVGVSKCLNHTLQKDSLLDRAKPFLYPVSIEYYLAACVIILDLLMGTNISSGHNEAAPMTNEVEQGREIAELEDFYGAEEDCELLDVGESASEAAGCCNKTQVQKCVPAMAMAMLVPVVGLAVGLVIVVFKKSDLDLDKESGKALVYSYYIIKVCSTFIQLLAALLAVRWIFLNRKKFQFRKVVLKAGDLLILVTSAGVVCYHTFNVFGAKAVFDHHSREILVHANHSNTGPIDFNNSGVVLSLGSLIFLASLFSLIEAAVQTAIIIYSGSIKHENAISGFYEKNLMRYLAITNLIRWTNGSMMMGSIRLTDPIKTLVYTRENWLAISRGLFPLLLFYRLHSCHLLWKVGNHLFDSKTGRDSEQSENEV